MPFFGILLSEVYEKKSLDELSDEEIQLIANLTKEIIGLV
jgi:hypothetical protein